MNKTRFYLLVGALGLLVTTLTVSTITFAGEGFGKKFENLSPEKQAQIQAKKDVFQQKHEELKLIFEEEDFDAWAELMASQGKDEEFITEENFAKYIEMHNLIQEGKEKFDQARVIAEELGIEKTGRHGKGSFGKVFHSGFRSGFRAR